MAVIYLRSTDGADVDDGLTWANAKATLAAALTAAGAGGTVYVSDNHAETQASAMTLTSPGTAASPTVVLCVDDTSDPEPPTALATTATVSTTGANSITFSGFAYIYGIAFRAGSAGNSASILMNTAVARWFRFDTCTLNLNNTNSGSTITIGQANSANSILVELVNTTLNFGNTSQIVVVREGFVWKNTPSAITGTVPTVLFGSSSLVSTNVLLEGVDLSALGSGTSLVTAASIGQWLLKDCKLGSSVTVVTGSVVNQNWKLRLINCDSADTNYRYYLQCYQGTISQETVILRTGGATDGTTPISRKMVSTANTQFYSPLESDWMPFWNETTGSALTIAIPVITDNVTLTDAEAWIEVEGLGTSGFPLGTFASDRATNILTTAANQTTDSTSTWTTTGLATPVKQVLSTTFTPQEKGFIRARVMLAKASTTMYFDPSPINASWVKYGDFSRMIGADGNAQMLSNLDPRSLILTGRGTY